MRRGVCCLVLYSLFAALAVAVPARGQTGTAQPPATSRPVLSIKGIGFPSEIIGLPRGGVRTYATKELGLSVRYGDPSLGCWADIYLYDRGRHLSSGASAQQVEVEMENLLTEARLMVQSGHYVRTYVTKRFQESGFEAVRLEIEQEHRKTDSFTFLRVHDGQYVKVRLSMFENPQAARIASSFVSDFRRMNAARKRAP